MLIKTKREDKMIDKTIIDKDPLTIKEDDFLSSLGLSRDDLDDSGDMLEDLKQIAGFDE
tara:strand:+ start:20 stop:196 length:177 start_codon:yes stop_codon:yes gene_type:complete